MKITKKQVAQLIEAHKKDTFLSHLSNILSRDFSTKGEVTTNQIKLWEQNNWIVMFYPVFIFNFSNNNQLISINTQLNPVGKLLVILFCMGYIWLIIPNNPLDFDVLSNWISVVLVLVFTTLFVLLAIKIYNFEKQSQFELIYKALNIEVVSNPKNEWELKYMLVRLFAYPFSIFVIAIVVHSLFTTGNIFMAIFGIGVCGTYLYTDLKLLIGKKKNS